MVLPNLLFDVLLFGLLVTAAALDTFIPATHGVASLLIVGGATYWAAQELSEGLVRRAGWSQESLATSASLCAGGFLYFLRRNESDLSLLVLSIGLMMASLMLAISVIAAVGAAFKEGRAAPLTGWVATLGGGLVLGALAGVLALVLGALPSQFGPLTTLAFKIGGLAVAWAGWKARESINPPALNPHWQNLLSQNIASGAAKTPVSASASPVHVRVALMPQRGTLLDRLVPLLVVGVALLLAVRGSALVSAPFAPAVASQSEK